MRWRAEYGPNLRMSLTVLAYNIKRTINILGAQKMVGALA
jgi:hypothetical protein